MCVTLPKSVWSILNGDGRLSLPLQLFAKDVSSSIIQTALYLMLFGMEHMLHGEGARLIYLTHEVFFCFFRCVEGIGVATFARVETRLLYLSLSIRPIFKWKGNWSWIILFLQFAASSIWWDEEYQKRFCNLFFFCGAIRNVWVIVVANLGMKWWM